MKKHLGGDLSTGETVCRRSEFYGSRETRAPRPSRPASSNGRVTGSRSPSTVWRPRGARGRPTSRSSTSPRREPLRPLRDRAGVRDIGIPTARSRSESQPLTLPTALRLYDKLSPFLGVDAELPERLGVWCGRVRWMPRLRSGFRRLTFCEWLLYYQVPIVSEGRILECWESSAAREPNAPIGG